MNDFNISSFDSKVFFIGYNKTATSTIHRLFVKNKFRSSHSLRWRLSAFQIFSDTGDVLDPKERYDYEGYLIRYPRSCFVLNTRSLGGWLKSRCRHYYWRGVQPGKSNFGYPVSRGMLKRWIESRNAYYLGLLLFFSSCPEKLVIVDIDRGGWISFLCGVFKMEPASIWVNKSEEHGDLYTRSWKRRQVTDLPVGYLNVIEYSIAGAYQDLNIAAGGSSLMIRSLTESAVYTTLNQSVSVFRNNLALGEPDV